MDAHLTPDELRELFLFADLTPEQLDWVAGCGDVVEVAAGANVVTEGEPSRCFYVLLSGTVAMSRMISGDNVETTRTEHRGSYFGAVQFYLEDESAREYPASVRAITDATVLALPAKDFAKKFAQWFPMARAPAGGHAAGHAAGQPAARRTGAPARAGQALGGAHPRAEQPGRRGDPGDGRVARQGHRHAQQARDDRRRADRGPRPAQAGDGPGRVRQEGAARAHAVAAGGLRPGGRAGRLVRRPRHRRRLGPRAGVRGGRARRRGHGGRGHRLRERAWWRARSAGSPTRSRAKA